MQLLLLQQMLLLLLLVLRLLRQLHPTPLIVRVGMQFGRVL